MSTNPIETSLFSNAMMDVTAQISTASRLIKEIDLHEVFAIDPAAVAVAERLSSYCRVDSNNGRIFRSTSTQKFGERIDYSNVSDDQIRLCFKIIDVYSLLPTSESETNEESRIGLLVSNAYDDDEGCKWFTCTDSGDLLVINARHIDGHKVLQAPSEREIYSHWEEIERFIEEENLQGTAHLAVKASQYTNWQQILEAVPPLFPSEKSQK